MVAPAKITPVQEVSKLTDRYQTTVPRGVRKLLNLRKGDQLCYRHDADGRVYLEAAGPAEGDPALGAFLNLLEADITAHPERLTAFDGGLRNRLQALVGGSDVDLDAALSPDDE
uniref:type II toxin-antitoxin system PrlF family antitoxin n=1 Tax=Pararhizobium sp. IMCC3301 TaxID=3067904 RepID=UPI002742900F|nr:type II toxin-antitoxin system PrlF family antitoxin [Pararhizobium sp. IMCC3301]